MASNVEAIMLRSYTPCLQCRLVQFAGEVDLEGTQRVKSSLHGLFSLQKKDGMTSLLAQKQRGPGVRLSPSKWKSIFWDTSTPVEGLGLFYTQDDVDGSVMEYLVDSEGVTLRRQLEFKRLQKAIESYSESKVSSVKLVGFEMGYLLFLVNSDTLCTAEILENVCLPCTWIPLPADISGIDEHGVGPFSILPDIIVVLDRSAQLLFIYDLHTGQFVCQIDLEPAGFPSGTVGGGDGGHSDVWAWSVSSSLETLVWLNSARTICHLNVEKYVRSRPSVVKLPHEFHGFSSMSMTQQVRTCRSGNFSWRHLLVDLHQQEMEKTSGGAWSSHKLSSLKRPKTSPKVSGFRARQGAPAAADGDRVMRRDMNFIQRFRLPSGSVMDVGYRVVEAQCSLSAFTLVLVSGADSSQRALCLVDMPSQQVYFHSFPSHHYPVLTTAADLPLLCLSPEALLLLVPPSGIAQEDIVSTMMVYSGAPSVDLLCQMNGWGRSTIPLHALELGLRQHQLDTVTIFLASKENLFSGSRFQDGSRSDKGSSTSLSPTPWTANMHHRAVLELAPAFDLFFKVIHNDIASGSPPQEFTERLLHECLDFFHTVLKDGLIVQNSLSGSAADAGEREDVEKALATVMEYVGQVREAMSVIEQRQRRDIKLATEELVKETANDEVDGGGDTPGSDIETLVEQACKENNMSGLQADLLASGRDGAAQWSQLVRIGLQRAWAHLQHLDIAAAQSIINSLGLSVARTVWDLCQFTTDRQVQRYIIHELRAAATLSHADLSLVDFLEKLYAAYPVASVKNHLALRDGKDRGNDAESARPLASLLRPSETRLAAQVKDMEGSSMSASSGEGLYCAVGLSWLQQLDEETRERLLLDAAVLMGESDLESRYPARMLWCYWLSRNDAHKGIQLLDRALSSRKERCDVSDYLHDLPSATTFVQHLVKTHLLRQEGVRSEVLHYLELPVEDQIHMLRTLLHSPHPLQKCGHQVLMDFHRQFAAYCCRYGFVLPLWKYCTVHGLDIESLLDSDAVNVATWLKPFVYLHLAVNQPKDPSQMFAASLSVASVHWKPDDWTLALLLKEGHVNAAVATLAYLPAMESLNQGEMSVAVRGLEPELLKSSLKRFPKLLSALLPPDTDNTRFDVNVYQLLRDNAPLDCRRLFGWQSTNLTFSEEGMRTLPYFSQADLVSRYAHTAKLNFTYYLRHGRPAYAFLSFLAEEVNQKTATVSPKRIQAACGIALWLAAKYFHNPEISSACVAFVEMLGLDSVVLRVYVQAGETFLAHSVRRLSGPVDKRKEQMQASEQEVASLLHSCLRNKHRHGRQLLTCLEDAVSEEISREGLSSTSVEAALKWNLVILMCNQLRLPLTSRFLEACARDDRWLPFIWFAQLHQYPKTQLHNLLHQFPSRHLRDHLHYVITNTRSNTVTGPAATTTAGQGVTGASSQDGSRNPRSSLYSKIGVKSSLDRDDVSSDEEEALNRERAAYTASARSSDDEDVEVTEESAAGDVFRVIFSALATAEPWKSLLVHAIVLRNPLFAELAGCCGAPIVSSLCTWLVSMLDPSEHARFVAAHGKRASRWGVPQLEQLVDVYLECHMETTLAVAFSIFQPTSPMLPFLQFISECVMWRNYEGCKALLDTFKELMAASSLAMNKALQDSRQDSRSDLSTNSKDPSLEVLGDRDWFERIMYRIVKFELVHCPSLYDAVHLLELLAEENIALVFSFDVLDFGHLHKMLEILHRHKVTDVDLARFFDKAAGSSTYQLECQRALDALMEKGVFEEAFAFGQIAGLNLSEAVVHQVKSEKDQLQSTGMWSSRVTRHRFWSRSAAFLGKHGLAADVVAKFFQNEAAETDRLDEKAFIFQLSLTHTERHSKGDLMALKDSIFTAMWRYRIQNRVRQNKKRGQKKSHSDEEEDIFSNSEELETSGKVPLNRRELLHKASLPQPQVEPANELNSEELIELEKIIGELLSEGRVSECCHLARTLGGHSTDLIIVLTCIGLSTGELTVNTMDPACAFLLTSAEKRRSLASTLSLTRVSSTVSLASAAPNWSVLPPKQEEIICTMEQLLARCGLARPCCLRIISVCKISCLIMRSYADVVMSEEFSVLRELLKTDFPQRYSLASEFLSTSSLTDTEVASFLVDEIVKSLRIYLGGKDGFDGTGRDGRVDTSELIFRPTEGGEVFSQLVSLCGDPAILGDKLLSALAAMSDHSPGQTQAVLSMETELLIMAHECHSAACNMEGISNVLRAARVCAQCLASAKQYQLMIRLLTGIGRYSEMTYIFDQLQQHHQFEMLLRKGIDKEDKLKIALLDYLKRFHGDDKETYSMVALNFSMYREIADMLDEFGHRDLAMLKDRPLDSSKEVQEILKKCIQYFGDAAESYVKDKCYVHAHRCLRLARLINLQLQLLGSGVRVINLTADEVSSFVAGHPKFLEAFVVTEAYGRTVDWSEALFQQVIVNGDLRYLQDLRMYVKLTPSLIENTLYKVKQIPNKQGSCLPYVKKLLKYCPDVWMQYKIAQDLGLQDIVRELIRSDSCSSYIKDMLASQ